MSVRSELGVGSTFFAAILAWHAEPTEAGTSPEGRAAARSGASAGAWSSKTTTSGPALYERRSSTARCSRSCPVRSRDEARRVLRRVEPVSDPARPPYSKRKADWPLLVEFKAREELARGPRSRRLHPQGGLHAGALPWEPPSCQPKPPGPRRWLLKTLRRARTRSRCRERSR